MFYIELFIYYILAVNVITFVVYGIDKLKAKKGWWRIPEATLLLLAAIGGSIGAWCGMMLFRHKKNIGSSSWAYHCYSYCSLPCSFMFT